MNPPTICPDEQESTVSIEPSKPRGRRPVAAPSERPGGVPPKQLERERGPRALARCGGGDARGL